MNEPNTELDKAIELCNSTLDENHSCCQSWRAIRIAKYAIEAAAKRLKEVEKERDELRQQLVPGFFGRMAAKKSIELQLLRTDYKKALDLLKTTRAFFTHDSVTKSLIDNLLSTPSAIAAMKGEV